MLLFFLLVSVRIEVEEVIYKSSADKIDGECLSDVRLLNPVE